MKKLSDLLKRLICQVLLFASALLCTALSVYAADSKTNNVVDADVKVQVFVGRSAIKSNRCAVLVHGLARSSASMNRLAKVLNAAGWHTANVDYPSRKFTVDQLAPAVFNAAVDQCQALGATQVDGVAHSLGGILFRHYTENQAIEGFGRFVMLGTPNHGSEVVDKLRNVPGFVALNGPAGLELGTERNSVPNRLGPAVYNTAVIAGTKSINLILSNFLPNPDDGKVSVQSARLEGMCAMLRVPVSHPFLMKDDSVIANTLEYLTNGTFLSTNENTPEYPACDHNNH